MVSTCTATANVINKAGEEAECAGDERNPMTCCRPTNHQKSRLRGRRRKKQRWKRRWQPWRLCAVCTIKLLKSASVCTSLGFGRNAHSKVLVHLTCRSSAIGGRVLFRNACNHRVRTSTSHILSSLASTLADHVNLRGAWWACWCVGKRAENVVSTCMATANVISKAGEEAECAGNGRNPMTCCRPKNHQKSRLRGRRRKKQRWKRRWQPWRRLCAVCTIKLLKSVSVCTSLGCGRNAHSKVLVHLTCRSSAIDSRVLFRNACNHRVCTSTSHILSSLASTLAEAC